MNFFVESIVRGVAGNMVGVGMNRVEGTNIAEMLQNMNLDSKKEFKILVIGDSNVGKTSLIFSYVDGHFSDRIIPTIGTDKRKKSININGDNYGLIIWDTAGAERFNSFTPSYFRGAEGAILVYDVNERSTFEKLDKWYNELELNCDKLNMPRIVVGNKIDLAGPRQITSAEGMAFARNHGMLYLEMSVKRNDGHHGPQQAFETLARKIVESKPQSNQNQSTSDSNRPITINVNSNNTTTNTNYNVDTAVDGRAGSCCN